MTWIRESLARTVSHWIRRGAVAIVLVGIASTGARAVDYVGNARCAPCHPVESGKWKEAPHALTLRPVGDGDRIRLAESLLCADRPVRRSVGLKRQIRYLAPDSAGVERVLPCRWNRVTDAWETVGGEVGPAWDEICAFCHETVAAPAREDGIGCEACHGPGGDHVVNPATARPFSFPRGQAVARASVCGSCHLQGGLSKENLTFPKGFRPGADLRTLFTYDWKSLDGAKGDHHAQKEIRTVLEGGSEAAVCVSCHDPHAQTALGHGQQPQNALCDECHVEGSSQLRVDREAVCPVCEL